MKESVLENKTREELEKKQRINCLLSVMFIDVVIFALYISQKILSWRKKVKWNMTDYEYILQQAKRAHYSGWDDAELRKCVDMLEGLSREQSFALYSSRWMKDAKILKDEIFRRLFAEQLGKREERIKNLSTEELIEEFRDKKSGNVSLIRSEMQERYKAGKDKADIANAFMESNKSDQKWIKAQMKDEQ